MVYLHSLHIPFLLNIQQQINSLGPQAPVREIIGHTLACAAPSLLMTSLSETITFVLEGLSSMPAVRAFSLCAGLAIFINLLLQVRAANGILYRGPHS